VSVLHNTRFAGRYKSICNGFQRGFLKMCIIHLNYLSMFPDDVIRMSPWRNPSGRTTALGSTQPPREMNTRNISWGVKAAGV